VLNLYKMCWVGDFMMCLFVLKELQDVLDLLDALLRIECYDVSNF